MKKYYIVKVGHAYVKYSDTLRAFGGGRPSLTKDIKLAKLFSARRWAKYKAHTYKYVIKDIIHSKGEAWAAHIKSQFDKHKLKLEEVEVEVQEIKL